jgi:hypothetical protein
MLFVLGFILMRRRNKKTVERWERESETFENGKIQN